MKDKILVTCALPYANGPLHIGHVRSTYLTADIYVRYLKHLGKDVAFICATDEHGTPITVRADKEKKKPIEIADYYHNIIEEEFKGLDINFDVFSRTSSDTNIKKAQEFFTEAEKNGYIYTKNVKQYYCGTCKRFLPDRYVEGRCPECGADGARGDHCEKCTKALEVLEDPYCIVCKGTPQLKETKHWFFKLTAFKEELEKYLNRDELPDNVKKYARGWVGKLQDWCITRDLSWGVPVPLKEADGKVLYVWWDAPIGYISATQKARKDWEELWKGKYVHFIGKDIIYHHALFWPAMLKAHGKHALPWNIVAGDYLSLEGKKMSTSRNWVVWIADFLKDYPSDYLRYYLTITSPITTDMDFSWKEFETRINNELSDILGNFVHRVLVFTNKFFDGKIPKPEKLDKKDQEVLASIKKTTESVGKCIEKFDFIGGLKHVIELAKRGNQYLNEKEPWKSKKAAPIYVTANLVKALAVLSEPYIPGIAQGIWEQLGLQGKVSEQKWEAAFEELKPGTEIKEPKPLVQKVEVKEEVAEFSGKTVVPDPVIEEKINKGELSIGLAELKGLNVQKRNRALERMKKAVRKEFDNAKVQEKLDSYRYMIGGVDKGTEGLSSENLINYVLSSGMLPNINTLTDVYNMVSFKTGLIMGAYDLGQISGNIRLKVTDGREKFTPIGSKRPVKIHKEEYALVDEKDYVITRWLTKEHEKVKVDLTTKGVIVCVQGNKDIPQGRVEKVLEEVCNLIVKFCGGEYHVIYPAE